MDRKFWLVEYVITYKHYESVLRTHKWAFRVIYLRSRDKLRALKTVIIPTEVSMTLFDAISGAIVGKVFTQSYCWASYYEP